MKLPLGFLFPCSIMHGSMARISCPLTTSCSTFGNSFSLAILLFVVVRTEMDVPVLLISLRLSCWGYDVSNWEEWSRYLLVQNFGSLYFVVTIRSIDVLSLDHMYSWNYSYISVCILWNVLGMSRGTLPSYVVSFELWEFSVREELRQVLWQLSL